MSESRTVTFSMNGFRHSLHDDLEVLKTDLLQLLEDRGYDYSEAEDVIDAFNRVACSSNAFNCVHVKGFEGFDDMSEVELPLIEPEDLES